MGGGARRRHRGRSELGSLNRRTSLVSRRAPQRTRQGRPGADRGPPVAGRLERGGSVVGAHVRGVQGRSGARRLAASVEARHVVGIDLLFFSVIGPVVPYLHPLAVTVARPLRCRLRWSGECSATAYLARRCMHCLGGPWATSRAVGACRFRFDRRSISAKKNYARAAGRRRQHHPADQCRVRRRHVDGHRCCPAGGHLRAHMRSEYAAQNQSTNVGWLWRRFDGLTVKLCTIHVAG